MGSTILNGHKCHKKNKAVWARRLTGEREVRNYLSNEVTLKKRTREVKEQTTTEICVKADGSSRQGKQQVQRPQALMVS
jgi:hypothetical protein